VHTTPEQLPLLPTPAGRARRQSRSTHRRALLSNCVEGGAVSGDEARSHRKDLGVGGSVERFAVRAHCGADRHLNDDRWLFHGVGEDLPEAIRQQVAHESPLANCGMWRALDVKAGWVKSQLVSLGRPPSLGPRRTLRRCASCQPDRASRCSFHPPVFVDIARGHAGSQLVMSLRCWAG